VKTWFAVQHEADDMLSICLPVDAAFDPDDDYLLALAISRRAFLVTGEQHLLVLGNDFPIVTPAQFAAKLRDSR
jgi:predicted nucleic acid-binding protein